LNQELQRPDPAGNPYAAPRAGVAAPAGPRPRQVRWAVTALWVAYGLTFLHGLALVSFDWRFWLSQPNVLTFELFYLVLIAFITAGRFSAVLLYAVLLVLRTVNIVGSFALSWQAGHWLECLTVGSFALQYLAMFVSLTQPARGWFRAPRA
jgi:hypothetical protein